MYMYVLTIVSPLVLSMSRCVGRVRKSGVVAACTCVSLLVPGSADLDQSLDHNNTTWRGTSVNV